MRTHFCHPITKKYRDEKEETINVKCDNNSKSQRETNVEPSNLKQAGLKITHPRKRILEILENKQNKHLTADDIYRCLVDAKEEIGLATVYRVLSQFESAGLVEKHNFESGQAYYELDSGVHHDHMVCVETGKVIEFISEDIEAAQRKIAEAHGYDIEDHSLVIYVRPKGKP
jgi:Fur family ferric uptake transcriptional regulator